MIAVRLPKELDERLEKFAAVTHRTKSFYIREALKRYLEDREDYLMAVARLEENNPRVPLKEALKKLEEETERKK